MTNQNNSHLTETEALIKLIEISNCEIEKGNTKQQMNFSMK